MEASIEKKKSIYKNMGDGINEFSTILLSCREIRSTINQEGNDVKDFNLQELLRLVMALLYKVIEMSVYLRACLNTDIVIEKRVHLKYIVFVTHEFYKQIFFSSSNKLTLWDRVSSDLLSKSDNSIKLEIEKVNESISKFKQNYFIQNNKCKRDISIHYDNPQALYNYYRDLSEEEEAKRICAVLDFVTPMIAVLKSYILVCQPLYKGKLKVSPKESYEIRMFRSKVILIIDDQLESTSKRLYKTIKIYLLPDKIKKLISERRMDEIYVIREIANIGILLMFVKLDLLASVKAYLTSESFIEHRINLIRLYLTINEVLNQICRQKNDSSKSLWEQYIYEPIKAQGDKVLIYTVERACSKIQAFMEDKEIKSTRNEYVHFGNGFKCDKLMDILLNLDNEVVLKKTRRFISLIDLLVRLDGKVLKMKTASICA